MIDNELLSGIGIIIDDADIEDLLMRGEVALEDLIFNGKFDGVKALNLDDLSMKPVMSHLIKNIYVNNIKKTVTVKFIDGEVRTSHCYKNDEFDVSVGVSLCISYYLFGSRTAFGKYLAVNAYNHVIDEDKKSPVDTDEYSECTACIVPAKEEKVTRKTTRKSKSHVKHL